VFPNFNTSRRCLLFVFSLQQASSEEQNIVFFLKKENYFYLNAPIISNEYRYVI